MSEFEIEKESAGYYNMGEGYVIIKDNRDDEKTTKITQYNCELNDAQIMKLYAFLQKNLEYENLMVYPKNKTDKIELSDRNLEIKFLNPHTAQEVKMSLSDVSDALIPDLYKALKKAKLSKKRAEFYERTEVLKESVEDLRDKIDDLEESIQDKVEDKIAEIKENIKTKADAQIGTIRDENGVPTVFREELKMLPYLRKLWHKIKSSDLYDAFRHSDFNPYHRGIRKVEADTLDEARRIVREDAKRAAAHREKIETQFIWRGTRYFSDRNCSPNQEYAEDGIVLRAKDNVADRIPRDKNGNLDLLAEEPILFSIIPIEGPALIGHVCMQYKDQVVNRLLPSIHTDPLYQKYKEFSEYYYVYPSQLGINPEKLYREMEKHNIKYMDKDYNPLFNNCAQNIGKILKKVGVKDLKFFGINKIGAVFASPGNNPFGRGVQAWCQKHGVRVHLNEVEEYDKRYPMTFRENKDRRSEMRYIKKRYDNLKER